MQAPVREDALDSHIIVLVGFMGAGKTSVGRALAGRLGWPFEDLDERIELREGRSVGQIFQQSGEAEFRRMEHEALRASLAGPGNVPRIIALGGGAFVQPANAAILEEAGVKTVFLQAPPEELFRRCAEHGTTRPLHKDAGQFITLYEARRPYYLRATVVVDTAGKAVDQVAQEIVERTGTRSTPAT